jgi:hypothetical protein
MYKQYVGGPSTLYRRAVLTKLASKFPFDSAAHSKFNMPELFRAKYNTRSHHNQYLHSVQQQRRRNEEGTTYVCVRVPSKVRVHVVGHAEGSAI